MKVNFRNLRDADKEKLIQLMIISFPISKRNIKKNNNVKYARGS